MLAAIEQSRHSIELETYIFTNGKTGRRFLDTLTVSARAGVRVRVLADAFGSVTLRSGFFKPLTDAGGEVRFFNPLRFDRFGVRNHRKLLICDDRVVFIGGANITDEYDGDGISHGWFDVVTRFEGTALAADLKATFENLFRSSAFEYPPLPRIRVFRRIRRGRPDAARILSIYPGHGAGIFQRALQSDLAQARSADFIMPYFLPNRRLRRLLRKIVRRGGHVRLILPAHCDVPVARAAGLVYYSRLMRSGVEIYEFQPQILHAKLYRVDGNIYCGSSNLDIRSLKLNYELMLRLTGNGALNEAKEIFETALAHSRRIELDVFRQSQSFWQRWKSHWAHFLLARIDPVVALRQFATVKSQLPPQSTASSSKWSALRGM